MLGNYERRRFGENKMNHALDDTIRYWLRRASEEGNRGFFYDYDLSRENQDADWLYFEEKAMEDIDRFLSNTGIV